MNMIQPFHTTSYHDALPYPFRVSADLSVLFEYYDALRKEAKASRQSEEDAAENIYAHIG